MHDTSQKPGRPDPGYTQADWDEVSDNPELTDAEIAELRPASEVPEVAALLPKRGRGRPKVADAKVNLTMRIDPALLAGYRATGDGWQVRMQAALEHCLPMFQKSLDMPAPAAEQDGGPTAWQLSQIGKQRA